MLVDSEIDLLTYQPEMVTTECLSTAFYHNVINSKAYQQDRYQQRALINMLDSWQAGATYEVMKV
jgi:hypothetical protein